MISLSLTSLKYNEILLRSREGKPLRGIPCSLLRSSFSISVIKAMKAMFSISIVSLESFEVINRLNGFFNWLKAIQSHHTLSQLEKYYRET